MFIAYCMPIVARDQRELEWMAKGFALPHPYPVFMIPRFLEDTLRYELMLDDGNGKLIYWWAGFEPTMHPMTYEIGGNPVSHAEALSHSAILAEPLPLSGVHGSPPPYFARNLGENSRIGQS
jgi:hypothetical protein